MQILENATTEYSLNNDDSAASAVSASSVQLTDVQQTLADAIRNHTEMECLQNNTDTYLLRELSPIRQNLLDWISFSDTETVLELGGKTGILTALLCKHCKAVTSVVASEADAYLNALRNENTGGLQIRVCASSSAAAAFPSSNFDTVTLIGADLNLHREIFTDKNSSTANDLDAQYSQLLTLAYEYLKPNGRLILAINNRLGIQYWSGKTDSCSPALFSSVQGDTEGQTEYCFSKKQLVSMLKKTGFESMRFYYPVPDYLYPTQIFSDDYLPQVGDIRPTSSHYDDIRYQLFDEKKAFDSLCEDGLFDVFANSFLVLCSKGGA